MQGKEDCVTCLSEESLREAECWSLVEGAPETFPLSGDVYLPRAGL